VLVLTRMKEDGNDSFSSAADSPRHPESRCRPMADMRLLPSGRSRGHVVSECADRLHIPLRSGSSSSSLPHRCLRRRVWSSGSEVRTPVAQIIGRAPDLLTEVLAVIEQQQGLCGFRKTWRRVSSPARLPASRADHGQVGADNHLFQSRRNVRIDKVHEADAVPYS